jgi:hypothetical protein
MKRTCSPGSAATNVTVNSLGAMVCADSTFARTNLAGLQSNNPLIQQSSSWDAASRLQSVTDRSAAIPYSASYTYLDKSPLVSQIVFKTNTTTRMTTTKSYDFLDRLASISSSSSSSSPISFNYQYNNANQRSRVTLADGSYWLFAYDPIGQVISGHKFWSDGSPAAGQVFDYWFDTIGNRTQTLAGGDQNGLNQRVSSYTANNLNQYTQRTVPRAVDVMGVSYATNTVTVNGNTAYRKGEYFRNQLAMDNSSSALWTNVIVAATGQTSVTGKVFVAKAPETFGYDLDGNMTNDGRWLFTWDGENRLVSMQGLAAIPTRVRSTSSISFTTPRGAGSRNSSPPTTARRTAR